MIITVVVAVGAAPVRVVKGVVNEDIKVRTSTNYYGSNTRRDGVCRT